ncbi:unnamed protein product [Peronospora belbahrii]|uniref:Reverse transcriptase/retrotransposon-derived protein RNase H-like domain-containing protein n=1 Tax=Peronospora belbahrii TaxID=622444 RepID=A0ABN8D156_9STRA|nr:unnamed protein product [Peronospora belbahrii]
MERCLVLDLDARYDLIPGMAWLERHETWIDWRSKTLGETRNASGGALESHEPTSARKQKLFWRGYCTESVNMLDVKISDFVDTVSFEDNSPGRGPVTVDSVVENPLDGTYDMCHENDVTSLNTVSGVGGFKPRCQDMSPSDMSDEELTVEGRVKSQMDVVFEDNKVNHLVTSIDPEGGVQSVNEVVFDLEVCAPVDADALDAEGIMSSDDDIASYVSALLELDELSFAEIGIALQAGAIAEVVAIRPEEELNSSSLLDKAAFEDTKKALNSRSGSQILKDLSDYYFPLLKEYGDVVSREPPTVLPPDRGVRHEIDLVPGTKYCVTRQWPLPRKQCDVIDEFLCAKHAAGMLNAATIPAQTPIHRKDVLQNNMVGCTMYNALDLVDGYYQLLMRSSDIPLTAVSNPSGMLWKCLVVPQKVSNAPATFNRLVTQLFRAHRQIPFLGCFIGKRGIWADPVKVKAIVDWPVPRNQKDLRKWMWNGVGNTEHHEAFEAIKKSLLQAPILDHHDSDRPFSAVFDASDFAIGSALLQVDSESENASSRLSLAS